MTNAIESKGPYYVTHGTADHSDGFGAVHPSDTGEAGWRVGFDWAGWPCGAVIPYLFASQRDAELGARAMNESGIAPAAVDDYPDEHIYKILAEALPW